MKRLLAFSAAALLAAGMISLAPGDDPPAEAAVGTTTTVYTLPPYAEQSLRAPAIGAFDASNLVVGWRNQANGLGLQDDSGDVLISRSTNGGTSWSSATTLKAGDATYAYVNITFFRDPGSSTMYAYIGRVNHAAGETADDMRLIAMVSTDDGATWADQALTMNYAGVTVTGGQVYKSGSTYLMPFHDATQHGVLKSTDLTTWDLADTISNPAGASLQEGSIARSVDDAGTLIMMMRVNGLHAYSSESTDGGDTWSAAVKDTNVPATGTKGYFGYSATGAQIAITGNAALVRRDAITYQVRYPGDAWGPMRFLADDQDVTGPDNGIQGGDGTYPQWDTYPNAIEVSPGKYMVVWETGTVEVRVALLDITEDSNGASAPWISLDGWSTTDGGAVEISPASQLRLLSDTSSVTSAYVDRGPVGGFRLQSRLKVDTFTANAPTSGVSAGMKVATGSHRLMLAIQADGVYTIQGAGPGWTKIYSAVQDNGFHTWRVDVDGSNTATLYKDGTAVGSTWTIQTSLATPRIEVWSNGSASLPAEAHFDNLYVNTLSVDTGWNNTTGWRTFNDGNTLQISPASVLNMTSTNGKPTRVAKIVAPRGLFTLQFRAQVTNYTLNNPVDGISFGTKVDTGQRRLMLALQGDGVYAMSSSSTWTKVYSAAGDSSFHTWRVEVDSANEATLYKDGTVVGSTWTLPASTGSGTIGGGVVEHWVDGIPLDDAEANVTATMVR